MLKKRAVMRSYLDLTINAYKADANFHRMRYGQWPNYYRNIVNGILDNKALYELLE